MTEVEVTDNRLIVLIKGIHRLLALKSRLEVPLEHVAGIERDPKTAHKGWSSGWFSGLWVGTRLPGRLRAGHFREGDGWAFWEVGDPEKAILVHLKNERYKKLVIEVSDPASTVEAVRKAIGER